MFRLCLLLTLGMLSPGAAADSPRSQSESEVSYSDVERFIGTWQVTAVHLPNDPAPISLDMTFTFAKGSLIIRQGKEKGSESTYQLNPTKRPAQIDVQSVGEKPESGIYELKGKTLMILLRQGMTRPREMKTTKGENEVLIVLKRAPKSKPAP